MITLAVELVLLFLVSFGRSLQGLICRLENRHEVQESLCPKLDLGHRQGLVLERVQEMIVEIRSSWQRTQGSLF